GLKLAERAAEPHTFIVASIGPLGNALPKPWREWLPDMPPYSYPPQDMLFETYSSRDELSRTLSYWYDCTFTPMWFQPFLVSIAYVQEPRGQIRSRDGLEPEHFAELAMQHFIWALGVNCGRDIGMDETIEIIRRYRRVTDKPLFARPNAG